MTVTITDVDRRPDRPGDGNRGMSLDEYYDLAKTIEDEDRAAIIGGRHYDQRTPMMGLDDFAKLRRWHPLDRCWELYTLAYLRRPDDLKRITNGNQQTLI